MGGIAAAHGKYVLMGDADDSYDFLEIPKFVEKLREGYDLVQGCRLPWAAARCCPARCRCCTAGGGNPMFSLMVRSWFHAPIHDVYCGLRGFTKSLYTGSISVATGMEFATEMIIKSSLYHERIAEVPINAAPGWAQGARAAPEDLSRRVAHAALFLMYSPRSLFLIPAACSSCSA
jgi:hypothetical protein